MYKIIYNNNKVLCRTLNNINNNIIVNSFTKWTPEDARIQAGGYGRLGQLKKQPALVEMELGERLKLENKLFKNGIIDSLTSYVRTKSKVKILWDNAIGKRFASEGSY